MVKFLIKIYGQSLFQWLIIYQGSIPNLNYKILLIFSINKDIFLMWLPDQYNLLHL